MPGRQGISKVFLLGLAAFAVFGLAGCRAPEPGDHPPTPQALVQAGNFLVSAAEPHAARAGLEILRRGGTAVDAAVAVQMVLTFTEPGESSIGGGGFLLFRDGGSGELRVYDGRETAPRAADAERFLLPGGIRMPFLAAVASGRAVGVPGVVAMLHQAHRQHGALAWPELFEPAIALSEKGIPMPRHLQRQVRADPSLWLFAGTRRFLAAPAGREEPVLVNQALGRTMRRLAAEGAAGFYAGELAGKMVAAVNGRWLWPGEMSLEDLRGYRAEERQPVCGTYREWTVCTIPPPSSGGLAVLQILGMLEHFPLSELRPASLAAVHLFAEASRLAYADLEDPVGDPAFVAVPVNKLLDRNYLAARAGLIDPAAAGPQVRPGLVRQRPELLEAAGGAPSSFGTTHFSIVDGAGNGVAMTSSIEVSFGNRNMVGGFLLNSQLTDFSFQPTRDGQPAANAVAPGKRPRSWMSPTIVLDKEGEIRLLIGSRGGAAIVAHVAKTIIGVLDWNLPLQEAIGLPNVVARGPELLLEEATVLAELADQLAEMGHKVRFRPLVSGLHGIERSEQGWRSGVDPRLGGSAAGN